MSFFTKKPSGNLELMCKTFYDEFILNYKPNEDNLSFQTYLTIKTALSITDDLFDEIDLKKFADEMIILELELFALAWLNAYGEESAINQSVYTKNYLLENKLEKIWQAMGDYNQKIASSSTFGKTEDRALDRAWITMINTTRMNQYKKSIEKGHDSECTARVLNRLFNEDAWKNGITRGLLFLAFTNRLGFDESYMPSKETHVRWGVEIENLYKETKNTLKNF